MFIKTSIKKAVRDEETPPKQKHVRRIIIELTNYKENKSIFDSICKDIYDYLSKNVNYANNIVIWKSLVILHQILQDSPIYFAINSYDKLEYFENVKKYHTKNSKYSP
ncbi:MAG: hypothetical protein Satyrvirus31_14, partial [Satyrvirus sp.]